MTKRAYRNLQALLLLATLFVLASSYYFQYVKGLHPCPLCIMQRICAFFLGMLCLMGALLATLKRGRHVAGFQMFFAAAGLFFSGRQLWLQSLPPEQTPACMPGLDILVRYFPLKDVMHALVWGAGDCAEVSWKWLGVSMPGWAALYFAAMFIGSALLFLKAGQAIKAE